MQVEEEGSFLRYIKDKELKACCVDRLKLIQISQCLNEQLDRSLNDLSQFSSRKIFLTLMAQIRDP